MDFEPRQEFCQIKSLSIFILLFLVSCGSKKPLIKKIDAVPVWFETEKRFSNIDDTGKPIVHPFFDLAPFEMEKDNTINYFMTTPIGGMHYYDIDLVSGRLFKRHTYCEQVDIWENYSEDIHRPKFAIGIVPRLLDQLGNPQKIIVFGRKSYFHKFRKDVTYSQRARVVGGVIHQYCQNHPCKTRDNWMSTLVLIAVNHSDPRYEKITNMTQLKKRENWNYFKAFMENGFGRTKNGPFEAPAYRMVGEIEGKEALNFAVKKGHKFKFSEMKKLRNSCQKLYDYLWEGSQVVRAVQKEKSRIEKQQKKKSDYLFLIETKNKDKSSNPAITNRFMKQEVEKVREEKILNDFKSNKKKYENFSKFFFDFYGKYAKRYKTCTKFVKPSTLADNPERHWFFTFINGFMNMEKSDYIYRCNKRGWVKNSRLSSGKRIFDLYAPRTCSTSSLDYAFDQIVTINSGLRRATSPHYRYIEYDYGAGGTHQKLQSWVYENGKVISCADDDDREARAKWLEKNPFRIFPNDLQWKRFSID